MHVTAYLYTHHGSDTHGVGGGQPGGSLAAHTSVTRKMITDPSLMFGTKCQEHNGAEPLSPSDISTSRMQLITVTNCIRCCNDTSSPVTTVEGYSIETNMHSDKIIVNQPYLTNPLNHCYKTMIYLKKLLK